MTNELQQGVTSQQIALHNLPILSTINNIQKYFPGAKITPPAVRSQIFKSNNRIDSKGRVIPGNGLAKSGAIVRCGRKVLIDVERYGAWLTSNETAVVQPKTKSTAGTQVAVGTLVYSEPIADYNVVKGGASCL